MLTRDLWRVMRETYARPRPWWHRIVPGWRAVLLLGLLGFVSCLLADCLVVPMMHLEGMRRTLVRLEEAAK